MAVREVLRYPHPALQRSARELSPEEREVAERVAGDLLDTMRSHTRCVGLAALQLDELMRIVCVDVSEHPKAATSHGLLMLVNPVVTSEDGSEVAREGCLSIPDLTANVRRATTIGLEVNEHVGPAKAASDLGLQ